MDDYFSSSVDMKRRLEIRDLNFPHRETLGPIGLKVIRIWFESLRIRTQQAYAFEVLARASSSDNYRLQYWKCNRMGGFVIEPALNPQSCSTLEDTQTRRAFENSDKSKKFNNSRPMLSDSLISDLSLTSDHLNKQVQTWTLNIASIHLLRLLIV